MSDLVVASGLNLQASFPLIFNKFAVFIKGKNHGHSFPAAFNGINQEYFFSLTCSV